MATNDAFGKCGEHVTHFSVMKLMPTGKKNEQKNERQAVLVENEGVKTSLDRFPLEFLSPEWILAHWGEGVYTIQWWVEKENKWTMHGYGREGVTIRAAKKRGRPPKQIPTMSMGAATPTKETASAPAVASPTGSVLPSSFTEMQAFMGIISEREGAATERLTSLITAVMGGRERQEESRERASASSIAQAIKAAVAEATAPLVAEIAAVKKELAEFEVDDDDEDDEDEDEVELPRSVKHAMQIAAQKGLKEVPSVSQIADLAKQGLSIARDYVNKYGETPPGAAADEAATD